MDTLYCKRTELQLQLKQIRKLQNIWDLTFKALKRLKELSQRLCGELFVVLGSHLHTDLQVLADVGRQHSSKALERILHRQGAKEIHEPLEV